MLWAALGWFFVALGFVGIFLPVLPTTPFLLLALGCFSRASPRLETWLLGHPRFGPSLQAWRAHGAIGRSAKRVATLGCLLGYGGFWLSFGFAPSWWLALLVTGLIGFALIFINTRPDS